MNLCLSGCSFLQPLNFVIAACQVQVTIWKWITIQILGFVFYTSSFLSERYLLICGFSVHNENIRDCVRTLTGMSWTLAGLFDRKIEELSGI